MMGKETYPPVTCINSTMEEPGLLELHHGSGIVFSTPAIDKVTGNEDAVAVIPLGEDALVLIVADGLGGLPAGATASRMVIECMAGALTHANLDEISIREVILDSIERANREILDLKNNSATTLVVAEIQGNTLRTYHAGDSMIMLMGNRGKIKYSAIPHSPVGYALKSGLMDESEAMLDEEKHLISNYIGSPESHVEVGPVLKMSARDTLVLASDGLSDNLFENEVVEICRKGDLLQAARKLQENCRKYMVESAPDRICHPDDLSFILFRLGGSNREFLPIQNSLL